MAKEDLRQRRLNSQENRCLKQLTRLLLQWQRSLDRGQKSLRFPRFLERQPIGHCHLFGRCAGV